MTNERAYVSLDTLGGLLNSYHLAEANSERHNNPPAAPVLDLARNVAHHYQAMAAQIGMPANELEVIFINACLAGDELTTKLFKDFLVAAKLLAGEALDAHHRSNQGKVDAYRQQHTAYQRKLKQFEDQKAKRAKDHAEHSERFRTRWLKLLKSLEKCQERAEYEIKKLAPDDHNMVRILAKRGLAQFHGHGKFEIKLGALENLGSDDAREIIKAAHSSIKGNYRGKV